MTSIWRSRRLSAPAPVSVVLKGRAYPKVAEVAAGTVVSTGAGVQRPFIACQGDAGSKLQGKTRGTIVAPLVADATVAVISEQSRPWPACIRSASAIHTCPESRFKRSHAEQPAGASAELLAIPARNLARLATERPAALLADEAPTGGAVAVPRAVLAAALPDIGRHDLKGSATAGADAIGLDNLYGHRATPRCLPRVLPTRRGNFMSRFYHAHQGAFAPIVDASELERSA